MREKKTSSVELLDFWANHFEFRDWNYTRQTNIKEIKLEKPFGRNELRWRVKMAVRTALRIFKKDTLMYLNAGLVSKILMPFYMLKRDKNTPDGVLDNGNIITFWEETGEYLQLVQPTVGALLANFLKEEPDNKHAKLITAEMDRILDRFSERIKNGEVE